MFLAPLLLTILAQTGPVAGQPIRFAAEHDGKNTVAYRLHVNGTPIKEVPATALLDGVVIVEIAGLPEGPHSAQLFAINRTADGEFAAGSNILSFQVGSGTGGGDPTEPFIPQTPINTRIIFDEPVPPVSETKLLQEFTFSCCVFAQSEQTRSDLATSNGSLRVISVRLPATNTGHVAEIIGHGNWTRAIEIRGAGSINIGYELWWSTAPSSTADLTIRFSEPVSSFTWSFSEWQLAGSGDIVAVATESFVKTIADRLHPSAAEGRGVSAQAGDLMVSGGTTYSSVGSMEYAAPDWTILEALGTRGITQYRLPTGPVTGDRAIWSADNPRLAVSAVVVFRRQ